MIQRHYLERLRVLLRRFPVVAILGPRQCGKTTFAKAALPRWRYLDLEKPSDETFLTQDPEQTIRRLDQEFILDEAQNTTPEQMKMFLTRLGFGSKMVITGDVTQVDLPGGKNSGLATIRKILNGVDDISFMDLTAEDVVRHRLISDIVSAYEAYDEAKEKTISQPRHLR